MKNIQVEELRYLILNKTPGPYILKYWNLNSDRSNKPEVFFGDIIMVDGEYDIEKDKKLYLCLHNVEDSTESDGFPVDFEYDSGPIEHFNNDHYQFSLYKK